jgi:hypothetical protein
LPRFVRAVEKRARQISPRSVCFERKEREKREVRELGLPWPKFKWDLNFSN